MTVLAREDSKTLRTEKFKSFLDGGINSSSGNYLHSLYATRLRYVDAAAMEIYHQLIWFLEDYPSVKSVSPLWIPEVEQDGGPFLVRFRLNLTTEESSPTKGVYLEDSHCGYEEYPPSIAMKGEERFDALIEAGENISQELWNEFGGFKLVDHPIYTSVDQVQKDMEEDLSEFLVEFFRWSLNQNLSESQKVKTSPRL